MATISGKYAPAIRVLTGLYSLDRAFENDIGELGVPVGVGYEIFGLSGIGKSTFAISYAGMLGRITQKNIVLADFEGFDSNTLLRILNNQGFEGNLHFVMEKQDEDTLAALKAYMNDDDYAISILDSIGSISPIAEQQGNFGEANMGRRAFILAQFSRTMLPLWRTEGSVKTLLMLNHWIPNIGTRGFDTPGGEAKKYLSHVRILLRRTEEFPEGSYVLEGEVKKNRYGFRGRKFYVFMLAGPGLHTGLTAVWDCVLLERAERKRGGWIAIGDTNVDRLSGLVKSAKEGNNEVFEPFFELLKEKTEDETDQDI